MDEKHSCSSRLLGKKEEKEAKVEPRRYLSPTRRRLDHRLLNQQEVLGRAFQGLGIAPSDPADEKVKKNLISSRVFCWLRSFTVKAVNRYEINERYEWEKNKYEAVRCGEPVQRGDVHSTLQLIWSGAATLERERDRECGGERVPGGAQTTTEKGNHDIINEEREEEEKNILQHVNVSESQ
ncbi:hypothetical protein RUM44_012593 [Polyplax serrata]|uniref:Cyclic nucleotide-binding domain-containing protein n=1 Tax=Polyplax serrata TaxID=468196 RepID=A0ABR1BG53_POLSC